MEIIVNGQSHEVSQETTLAALLEDLQLRATHVAIEVNLELAPRTNHSQRILSEGDRVEIVTLVGGG